MSSTPLSNFEPATLEAQHLRCDRGIRTLFEQVGFKLASGEALRITGANGSGKTSLLRILATLSESEDGTLRWNDEPIVRGGSRYLCNLAFLGHKNALKQDLTVQQNLVSLSALHHRAETGHPAITVSQALDQLDVAHIANRPVRQLSAGQRQRVALARIWLSDASLWILDEPATALDPEGIERLEQMIENHLQREGMLVYTSHQDITIDPNRLTSLAVGVP